MHHTLELNEAYNGFRYDSIFSGVPLDNLPDNIPFVKKVIEQVKGNLYIKWHPTKKFSPDGLRSSLDRAHLFGTFPDVVTVDYADLMRFPKTFDGRKDELIQELYEELRSIAGEYSVVLWTASQTNREGARQKVVTGDTVSEAFVGKIGTADFCMSWARDKQHKDRGTAVASVLKNRFGAEGDYYAIFDTTKGYIEIFSPGSKESQMIEQGILSEEDYNKQYLRNAYKSFQKNQRLVQ
jgi:replicative DNA helicase